ncbi:hypothetical protein ACA910_003239 [Epithemia clementina (nom. ined.)]
MAMILSPSSRFVVASMLVLMWLYHVKAFQSSFFQKRSADHHNINYQELSPQVELSAAVSEDNDNSRRRNKKEKKFLASLLSSLNFPSAEVSYEPRPPQSRPPQYLLQELKWWDRAYNMAFRGGRLTQVTPKPGATGGRPAASIPELTPRLVSFSSIFKSDDNEDGGEMEEDSKYITSPITPPKSEPVFELAEPEPEETEPGLDTTLQTSPSATNTTGPNEPEKASADEKPTDNMPDNFVAELTDTDNGLDTKVSEFESLVEQNYKSTTMPPKTEEDGAFVRSQLDADGELMRKVENLTTSTPKREVDKGFASSMDTNQSIGAGSNNSAETASLVSGYLEMPTSFTTNLSDSVGSDIAVDTLPAVASDKDVSVSSTSSKDTNATDQLSTLSSSMSDVTATLSTSMEGALNTTSELLANFQNSLQESLGKAQAVLGNVLSQSNEKDALWSMKAKANDVDPSIIFGAGVATASFGTLFLFQMDIVTDNVLETSIVLGAAASGLAVTDNPVGDVLRALGSVVSQIWSSANTTATDDPEAVTTSDVNDSDSINVTFVGHSPEASLAFTATTSVIAVAFGVKPEVALVVAAVAWYFAGLEGALGDMSRQAGNLVLEIGKGLFQSPDNQTESLPELPVPEELPEESVKNILPEEEKPTVKSTVSVEEEKPPDKSTIPVNEEKPTETSSISVDEENPYLPSLNVGKPKKVSTLVKPQATMPSFFFASELATKTGKKKKVQSSVVLVDKKGEGKVSDAPAVSVGARAPSLARFELSEAQTRLYGKHSLVTLGTDVQSREDLGARAPSLARFELSEAQTRLYGKHSLVTSGTDLQNREDLGARAPSLASFELSEAQTMLYGKRNKVTSTLEETYNQIGQDRVVTKHLSLRLSGFERSEARTRRYGRKNAGAEDKKSSTEMGKEALPTEPGKESLKLFTGPRPFTLTKFELSEAQTRLRGRSAAVYRMESPSAELETASTNYDSMIGEESQQLGDVGTKSSFANVEGGTETTPITTALSEGKVSADDPSVTTTEATVGKATESKPVPVVNSVSLRQSTDTSNSTPKKSISQRATFSTNKNAALKKSSTPSLDIAPDTTLTPTSNVAPKTASVRPTAQKAERLEAGLSPIEMMARERAEAAKRQKADLKVQEERRQRAEAARRAEEERRAEVAREEAERARLEAEAVERARLKAEAAERERLEEAAEKARLEEAARQARLEQALAEKSRLEAEAAERARLEAEAAEKARLEAEAAEKARLEAEAAKKARLEEALAEKARLVAEAAARKARLEEEAAEKARLEEEAAEKARLKEEAAEKARLEEEAAEKARIEKEAAEKAKIEKEAAEKARLKKVAAEKARLEKEAAEKARLEEEESRALEFSKRKELEKRQRLLLAERLKMELAKLNIRKLIKEQQDVSLRSEARRVQKSETERRQRSLLAARLEFEANKLAKKSVDQTTAGEDEEALLDAEDSKSERESKEFEASQILGVETNLSEEALVIGRKKEMEGRQRGLLEARLKLRSAVSAAIMAAESAEAMLPSDGSQNSEGVSNWVMGNENIEPESQVLNESVDNKAANEKIEPDPLVIRYEESRKIVRETKAFQAPLLGLKLDRESKIARAEMLLAQLADAAPATESEPEVGSSVVPEVASSVEPAVKAAKAGNTEQERRQRSLLAARLKRGVAERAAAAKRDQERRQRLLLETRLKQKRA